MAKLKYTFAVTIIGQKDEPQHTVTINGNCLQVNQRGDLMVCDSLGMVACFRSGSWLRAERLESPDA